MVLPQREVGLLLCLFVISCETFVLRGAISPLSKGILNHERAKSGFTGGVNNLNEQQQPFSHVWRKGRRGVINGVGGASFVTSSSSASLGVEPPRLERVSLEQSSDVLTVREPKTGAELACNAKWFAVIDGIRYLVASPVNDAVAIAYEEKEDILFVPPDSKRMDEIFPNFCAAFKEANPEMELLRTPMCLTLKGYKPTVEDENDEDDMKNVDTEEEALDEEEDEDGDDEEMCPDDDEEPLGLVWLHEMQGKDMLLVRFLEPVLMVARESSLESNVFSLLEVDEEEEIGGKIEDLIHEEDQNCVKQLA